MRSSRLVVEPKGAEAGVRILADVDAVGRVRQEDTNADRGEAESLELGILPLDGRPKDKLNDGDVLLVTELEREADIGRAVSGTLRLEIPSSVLCLKVGTGSDDKVFFFVVTGNTFLLKGRGSSLGCCIAGTMGAEGCTTGVAIEYTGQDKRAD
jgi:hypothetical protein